MKKLILLAVLLPTIVMANCDSLSDDMYYWKESFFLAKEELHIAMDRIDELDLELEQIRDSVEFQYAGYWRNFSHILRNNDYVKCNLGISGEVLCSLHSHSIIEETKEI